MEGEFGGKHALFYLESATRIVSKRKTWYDEKIANSAENKNEIENGNQSKIEEFNDEVEKCKMTNENFENDEKKLKQPLTYQESM